MISPEKSTDSFFFITFPPVIGLYDQDGVFRFAGPDPAACLAYAELFGLGVDGYTLESLSAEGSDLFVNTRD